MSMVGGLVGISTVAGGAGLGLRAGVPGEVLLSPVRAIQGTNAVTSSAGPPLGSVEDKATVPKQQPVSLIGPAGLSLAWPVFSGSDVVLAVGNWEIICCNLGSWLFLKIR